MTAGRIDASAPELVQTAAFRSALRKYLNNTETATAQAGLTTQRYDLLLMIKAAELAQTEATVSSLCTSLALKQSSVSELVQRAEQAGLLRRDRSEADGRVAHLRLTADGEARLLRVFEVLRDDRAAFRATAEHLASVEP